MTPDQVDPVILSAYRWLDFIGVVLMGIIGGTIARQKGYDIGGASALSPWSPPSGEAWFVMS